MKRCHKCGTEWKGEEVAKKQPAVKDYCEKCSAYLHCCLNCRFYDKYAHNQCRIGTTDWVGDREGPNFCDEFEFADTEDAGKPSADARKAKHNLDKLLNDSGDTDETPGIDDFKKLFGD